MKHSAVKVFYKYKIYLNFLLAWEVFVIQNIINLVKQEFLRQNISLEFLIWGIFFWTSNIKKWFPLERIMSLVIHLQCSPLQSIIRMIIILWVMDMGTHVSNSQFNTRYQMHSSVLWIWPHIKLSGSWIFFFKNTSFFPNTPHILVPYFYS